mgnify:FL=1
MHPKISRLRAVWIPIINNLTNGINRGVEAAARMRRSTGAILGVH